MRMFDLLKDLNYIKLESVKSVCYCLPKVPSQGVIKTNNNNKKVVKKKTRHGNSHNEHRQEWKICDS